MGDGFQIVVDREVSEEDAPRLAERIRDWLISRRIIQPELTDCTLGEPGHPPGEAHPSALADPSLAALHMLTHMLTNGVEITVGRSFFWTPYTDLTCRACGARCEPYEEWVEAVGAWHEDDAATFACPTCGHPERVTEWTGVSPCGFGNLGLTFWNWPPLSEEFVREVTRMMGHRTRLVRGKI
jgi:hypothetical protein